MKIITSFSFKSSQSNKTASDSEKYKSKNQPKDSKKLGKYVDYEEIES